MEQVGIIFLPEFNMFCILTAALSLISSSEERKLSSIVLFGNNS